MRRKTRWSQRILFWIGLPLLFCVLGYGALALLLGPVLSPVQSLLSVFTTDSLRFEPQLYSIFEEGQVPDHADAIPIGDIRYPSSGTEFGLITCTSPQMRVPLYFDDTYEILRKGAGLFPSSNIPGMGGTVLVGAHKETYFSNLKELEPGDEITVKTHYGTYRYRVSHIRIIRYNELKMSDIRRDKEELILYTCYPFDSFSNLTQRYLVYADFVSGPKIVE